MANPFNFDFMSVPGGYAQPQQLNWQAAPGAADVSQVDEWLSPLIQAKAQADMNRFKFGTQIGAEQGAMQSRQAQQLALQKAIEEQQIKSALGARLEGMGEIDVTDPMSPEAQAARVGYGINRQGSQDELFDAQKRGQIANTESLIADREADNAYRRENDEANRRLKEADQSLRRESDRLRQMVAEGRLDIAQARIEMDRVSREHKMKTDDIRSGVAVAAQGLREARFGYDQYRTQNPGLFNETTRRQNVGMETNLNKAGELLAEYQPGYSGWMDAKINRGLMAMDLADPRTAEWTTKFEDLIGDLRHGRFGSAFTANEQKMWERVLSSAQGDTQLRAALQNFNDTLQRNLEGRRAPTGTPGYNPGPRYSDPRLTGGGGSASDLDNTPAPKKRLRFNPATGDFE